MTKYYLHTTVEQTDSAGIVIHDLDVTITFCVHGGSKATSTDTAYDAEIEILSVEHGDKNAPDWAWSAANDSEAVRGEMWEVVAADREDAAEFHAQCRREDYLLEGRER